MAQEFKEKTITINLSKVFNKPLTKRSRAALWAVKEAVKKETRKTELYISNGVNEAIWSRGRNNSPRRLIVKVVADEKNKAIGRIYLPDEKIVEKKDKKADAKKEEKKAESKKEEKKVEAKKDDKAEKKKEAKSQEAPTENKSETKAKK